ncbi:MAG: porin [Gammaproteobacteria bacterium]|uniref:porin n=1 Tax=Rhodoferax sp. TaxID=50421 RepID=UPI0018406A46|nr:porin [Rhodoferax sp.]MBU3900490.1 porin [Gammaproteobacteria bacterium]MBA3059957.1 porin [Rhodoferax sp.]MBU3996395.1 porin [Gammaproteobacteria bacterium]MBU4079935.1 porin [Gammaproteobacteria bacterium]MBU4112950.1 porin [Gammaproteobacteria bacterium]
MKKSLVALAALAVVGAASAQSAVTLSGNYGAGYLSTEINGVKNKGIALTAATLKVGVTEDLGSGLKAAVNMQFDSYGSSSTQNFAQALLRRNTSISLTGGFGQVRFDNTRSGNLLTRGMVGPVNLDQGIYDTTNVITRSAVDALTYGMAVGDFTGYAQYVEAAADGATTPAAKVVVLGAGYAKGPIAAGLAYKMYDYSGALAFLDAGATEATRSNRLEAFATYDFGVAKIGVGFDGKNVGKTAVVVPGFTETATDRSNAYSLGVSAPLGPVTLGVNFAKRGDFKVTELGANYNLSKRTALTAGYGRHTADEGNGLSGDQYLVAMTHSF